MVTIIHSSISSWFNDFLAFMGDCFGCYKNPTPITTVDELSTGLIIQGPVAKKSSISDDFWSNSTFDFDSVVQSQSSQSEFVNHGFLIWNQSRRQWLESGRSRIQTRRSWKFRLSWNVTYDSLLTNQKPFSHPIPLSEMVDFLVDVWDHEGLYD